MNFGEARTLTTLWRGLQDDEASTENSTECPNTVEFPEVKVSLIVTGKLVTLRPP